jgi:hypothetical protein
MAVEISLKKGTANPTSGLTLAEPLFNSTNNTLWMGKGSANTPIWIGAGICGASGGIAAGLTYQIPTLGAVKDYVTAVGGGGGGGAVSSVSGSGNGISVSPTTGAVVVSNTGVHSFNGLTGAVGGVCAAQANTFTALQTFTAGISAAGGITFNGGKVWTSANDGADSGLDADALRGVSGDRFIEEVQTGLLYGGVLSINAGNTAAVDVSAGAGIIVTVNASTGGYPAPTLQTIEWTAKTGVTLAGMTTSDFTFFRIDSSGNLQQASNNFTQTEYSNSIIIGNAVHQSRAFVNRVHYHPIVAYASSAQYETFIRYFGPLKVDGYVMSGFGVTGGIQHTTGTAFALGANMDTDVNNPSLVTDSASVPVQQLFYMFRNAGGTYITDPTARTTVNFGNYDDGDGTLGNVGNNNWSIQRVYKIPGVNNALYIYYGHAVYSTLTVAANNILLESFAEADITRYNGVFLGWLVVRGNGSNVSSSGDCRIIPGGFFRNTTGGGGASTQLNLDDLGDVQITSVANNEILRYDGTQGLWVNSAVTTLPLVTSFNGLTGAVQGVSAAVAGTGISVSGATGAVTITNIGVQSFNGLTGAVTGVTVGGANIFTALNTFNTGISAAGGTFSSLTRFTAGISSAGGTFSSLTRFTAGITASTLYVSGGATFAGALSAVDVYATSVYVSGGIFPSGSNTLNLNTNGNSITNIGDVNNDNNNTTIQVDDSTGTITLSAPVGGINNSGGFLSQVLAPSFSDTYSFCETYRTTTSSTAANQTIATIPGVFETSIPTSFMYYPAFEVTISARDTVLNKTEMLKMLVVQDGTNTVNTQYGLIRTGATGPVSSYSTSLIGAPVVDLRIRATPLSANSTVFTTTVRAQSNG